MFRLLSLLFGGSLILVACGGPPTEISVAIAIPTPTEVPTLIPPSPTPLQRETPTSIPASPTPPSTATPVPLPASPTPLPEEAAATYNPDLNYAQVIFVRATQGSDGRWKFDATVHHNDEGWDHYADAWQVVDPDGNLLAERVLTHPHDTEQPFTRSQSNIDLPPELTTVVVRAKCNIHGFGGQEVVIDLTVAQGKSFEVITNQ